MFPVAMATREGGIDARSLCCEDFLWVVDVREGHATIQCNGCGGIGEVPDGELTPALFVAACLEVRA